MGLNLQVFGQPVFLTGPDCLFKGRDLLVSIGTVAEIIFFRLGQGHIADPATAVGGTVDRLIVQDDRHIVLCKTDIRLNSVESQLGSQFERNQRVLWRILRSASVGHFIITGGFVVTYGLSESIQIFTVVLVRLRSHLNLGRYCIQFGRRNDFTVRFPDRNNGIHAFGNNHAGAVSTQGLFSINVPQDQLISLPQADQVPFPEVHDRPCGSRAVLQFPVRSFADDRFFRNVTSVDASYIQVSAFNITSGRHGSLIMAVAVGFIKIVLFLIDGLPAGLHGACSVHMVFIAVNGLPAGPNLAVAAGIIGLTAYGKEFGGQCT